MKIHPEITSCWVVGLVGGKRAGKDTAARYLSVRGFERVALADPMKAIVANCCGGEILKSGQPPRVLWQQVGTEIGRLIAPTLWIELLQVQMVAAHRFAGKSKFVVSDVRFENEAAAIREMGGRLIEIRRPDAADETDSHASEQEWRTIAADYVIHNDQAVLDLCRELAAALVQFSMSK